MTDHETQEVIQQLRELYHNRVDLHTSEKSATLRMQAKCRRACSGDKDEGKELFARIEKGAGTADEMRLGIALGPFFESRALLARERTAVEGRIAKLAIRLPVWQWADQVCGLGAKGLGYIVAEAAGEHDEGMDRFDTVSKLWKRFGLAVIGGGRQRKCSNEDKALEHGYCPRRRALVWKLGDSLLKQQGYFRDFYLHRLFHQVQKAEAEGLIFATSQKDTVESWKKRGLPLPELVKKIGDEHRSCGHIHNRAKREMEKELLKHLWLAWQDPSRPAPERDFFEARTA